MKTGAEILNEVQRLMIDFANKNSISLQSEFGSVEKFKEFVIAFTVSQLVSLGMDISQAFDVVFGAGSYSRLAEDIWNNAQIQQP